MTYRTRKYTRKAAVLVLDGLTWEDHAERKGEIAQLAGPQRRRTSKRFSNRSAVHVESLLAFGSLSPFDVAASTSRGGASSDAGSTI